MKKVWDEYVNMQLIFKFICHLWWFLVFSYYLCKPKIKIQRIMNKTKSLYAIYKYDFHKAPQRAGTIYDLQGRPRGTDPSALPKGIYIIDGKKVVK